VVPPGRRRFATLFAKANGLARKPALSDFSWVGDVAYSWDMATSSSRDSDEDEAGDAGSRGEFMAEQCTAGVMFCLPGRVTVMVVYGKDSESHSYRIKLVSAFTESPLPRL